MTECSRTPSTVWNCPGRLDTPSWSRLPQVRIHIHIHHTGHISIGGQDGEIEGKKGGISGQNRGQQGGISKQNRGQNQPKSGNTLFQPGRCVVYGWLCHLTNSHPVKLTMGTRWGSPVDNRPSTNYLHHFVKTNLKDKKKSHVTGDTWKIFPQTITYLIYLKN